MFTYKPLFKLLVEKEMTKTELRQNLQLGTTTLAKLSKNEYVALNVLDRICNYFDCKIEDIIEHIPDGEASDGIDCIADDET